jgi:7,8-dihydropterin-6-yl-methyl-4-(beta-D-ribofuranosyl)aminobenzene 5'-phosphate synthase
MTIARTHGRHARRWHLAPAALAACLLLAVGCSAAGSPSGPTPSDTDGRSSVPATETAEPEATEVGKAPHVILTIVYDNNPPAPGTTPGDPPLRTGWGFSCLVQRDGTTLLFDTGGDGATLQNNLEGLGIDPADIDIIVLSHYHSDHTGGLDAVLDAGATSTIFVPASFPEDFKDRLATRTSVVEVTGPAEIAEGFRTTGEMGSSIVEQALVVDASTGLVLVTGCAHPGIVAIVRSAAGAGDVDLVMGGFHLRDESPDECAALVAEFEALGVARVAPTHCTGETARASFAAAFGDSYVPAGVGTVIEIPE